MSMETAKESQKFFVHPAALCESKHIGEGTRVWGLSQVMAGAKIGRHCNICAHVFIENDVVIGDGCTIKNGVAIWDGVLLEERVFVGPYAVFTNDLKPRAFLKRSGDALVPTLVGRGATIGANATIVCGVRIGQYAFIGAGAVVTRDVPAHGLVLGNPGTLLGLVCFCGEKLDRSKRCPSCEVPLSENSEAAVIRRVSGGLRGSA